MFNNYYDRSKRRLAEIIVGAWSNKRIADLVKIQWELIKLADPDTSEVCSSMEQLSESIGYSPDGLKANLRELARLNLIEMAKDEGEYASLKIRVLVR